MIYVSGPALIGLMTITHQVSLPTGAVWLDWVVNDPRSAVIETGFRRADGEEIVVSVSYRDTVDIDVVVERLHAEAKRLAAL